MYQRAFAQKIAEMNKMKELQKLREEVEKWEDLLEEKIENNKRLNEQISTLTTK